MNPEPTSFIVLIDFHLHRRREVNKSVINAIGFKNVILLKGKRAYPINPIAPALTQSKKILKFMEPLSLGMIGLSKETKRNEGRKIPIVANIAPGVFPRR